MEKPIKLSGISYPWVTTIRLDDETWRELRIIALFERKKTATLLRDFTIDKVQAYQRNPTYNRFKKQLDARRGA